MRFSPNDVLALVAILAAAIVILTWVTSRVPSRIGQPVASVSR
jgi:hypothetical protein